MLLRPTRLLEAAAAAASMAAGVPAQPARGVLRRCRARARVVLRGAWPPARSGAEESY